MIHGEGLEVSITGHYVRGRNIWKTTQAQLKRYNMKAMSTCISPIQQPWANWRIMKTGERL